MLFCFLRRVALMMLLASLGPPVQAQGTAKFPADPLGLGQTDRPTQPAALFVAHSVTRLAGLDEKKHLAVIAPPPPKT